MSIHKVNKARILLPWETYTLTLGSMRALLAIRRREYLDGRAARPLIVRGLATWVGQGNKMRVSLTDRGTELAKAIETLVLIEGRDGKLVEKLRALFPACSICQQPFDLHLGDRPPCPEYTRSPV